MKYMGSVEFDNGETIETEVADNTTDEEIKNYYAKGQRVQLRSRWYRQNG